MGSKQWMLGNGLGHLLVERASSADRFVDLFSGTAAVSWLVAEKTDLPVLAVDLQTYSAVMARAVIGRTRKLASADLSAEWIDGAAELRRHSRLWRKAISFKPKMLNSQDVLEARRLCMRADTIITRSYGGHYFSPEQAITADALLQSLPTREPKRSACLAALIWAITRCVASPGHTAQPFQPTDTALPFIRESWSKDLLVACNDVLPLITNQMARAKGKAIIGDAIDIAAHEVGPGDLVFLDPPYSAAQYSRFYHVLETVARGSCGVVSGGGRYPPFEERPRSRFSLLSEANQAVEELLCALGQTGCAVVMTFPQHGCSNGVVGEELISMARQWFEVDVTSVNTRHSTLGGNNTSRSARRKTVELILSLTPR
jgi:16S rRNA G966 N2-methylase RsmD